MPRILVWDAGGEVIALGSGCTLFEKGDAVYYAGSISRPGINCEFHLVDERIVGRKPKSLSFEEAAAMPLTTKLSINLFIYESCPSDEKIEMFCLCKFRYLSM
jgi:NADPH:quinone reductase-like Zn-dependent oxidoreductase